MELLEEFGGPLKCLEDGGVALDFAPGRCVPLQSFQRLPPRGRHSLLLVIFLVSSAVGLMSRLCM